MNIDTNLLRSRLKLKHFASEKKLLTSHSSAKKFFNSIGIRPGKIRQHAAKLLASGALAANLLLPIPTNLAPLPISAATLSPQISNTLTPILIQQNTSKTLQTILPPTGNWQLDSNQEEKISDLIAKNYGVKATAQLDGNRLNNSYGRMGAEQHLPRYPGDTATAHGQLVEKGITPELGGWGYVSDFEIEKYYVAVQSIYLPDWREKLSYYIKWFKYRRVVVVNPANGKTIITAVADAGPAQWTGKHFGGSPEVMQYLGIDYGKQNHPVILFFLDDPDKKIPLGPLEYNINQ